MTRRIGNSVATRSGPGTGLYIYIMMYIMISESTGTSLGSWDCRCSWLILETSVLDIPTKCRKYSGIPPIAHPSLIWSSTPNHFNDCNHHQHHHQIHHHHQHHHLLPPLILILHHFWLAESSCFMAKKLSTWLFFLVSPNCRSDAIAHPWCIFDTLHQKRKLPLVSLTKS